jgi:hypothetical protein
VTAGRNALGIIEQVEGGFVATSAFRLAIHYQWHQDVDGRLTPPDPSGRWFYADRWTDWTLWRRVTLELAP